MQAPKPIDFLLLLEVFRRGLIFDLVSRNDVTSWADELILNTDEPDYFLIEVSLCNTQNHLIEIIGEHAQENDKLICTRVLMGLLYKKLIDDNSALTVNDAITILWNIEWRNTLTDFELSFIHTFDDYGFADFRELEEDVIGFLSVYEPFTLANYSEWIRTNEQIELTLRHKETEQNITIAAIREEWRLKNAEAQKTFKKQSLRRNLNISILIVVVVGILFWAYLTPSSSPIDWGAIIGSVVICVLLIWKEYVFKKMRQ